MDVFVARQPILDTRRHLFAYELLFRSGSDNRFSAQDGDQATAQVIETCFMAIGMGDVARMFINFTEKLLLNRTPLSLPPDHVTVEVLEDVVPTPEIIEAVRELRAAGYMIALDDFLARDTTHPLIPLSDIIKVDFAGTTPLERRDIITHLQRPGLFFLAEKVEDYRTFRQASRQGYTYFQGFYFQKPEMLACKKLSGNKLNHMRLLAALGKPEWTVRDLSNIIRQDVTLTYKLLKFINSPYFGLKRTVNSIDYAINLLGTDQIRRWAALVTMDNLGEDKPSELIFCSLVRGLLCEQLFGQTLSGRQTARASSFFLTGLLSLLDALVDMPMQQVLEDLPVDPEVHNALMGHSNLARDILDTAIFCEQGCWQELEERLQRLRIEPGVVFEQYRQSLMTANLLLGYAS